MTQGNCKHYSKSDLCNRHVRFCYIVLRNSDIHNQYNNLTLKKDHVSVTTYRGFPSYLWPDFQKDLLLLWLLNSKLKKSTFRVELVEMEKFSTTVFLTGKSKSELYYDNLRAQVRPICIIKMKEKKTKRKSIWYITFIIFCSN